MLFAGGNLNRKRFKNSACLDVKECLLKCFQQCRDNNINMSGMTLKEIAEYFAKTLGHN